MRSAPWLIGAGLMMLIAGILLWRFDAPLDLALLDHLRLTEGEAVVPVIAILTRLGGFAVLAPITVAVVVWLSLRQREAPGCWLLLTVGSGRFAVEGVKLLLTRPRPPLTDRLANVTSYSFPSSHSAGTMLTCLALALLMPPRPWRLPLAIMLACAIGWTRLALGVHWPSDVIAGLGFGMLWVGAAARWLPVP